MSHFINEIFHQLCLDRLLPYGFLRCRKWGMHTELRWGGNKLSGGYIFFEPFQLSSIVFLSDFQSTKN